MEKIAQKGLVMCHIGSGKGKTTAAMGVAVRASGNGMNVFVLQFVKSHKTESETDKLSGEWPISKEIIFFQNVKTKAPLGLIDTEQVGKGFVGILGDTKHRTVHEKAAQAGLKRARVILHSQKYNLIILDEIISAVELNLISENAVVELIKRKHPSVHVILTGHNRFESIIEHSDLVTEMKMIKHPYYQGQLAQAGIDY